MTNTCTMHVGAHSTWDVGVFVITSRCMRTYMREHVSKSSSAMTALHLVRARRDSGMITRVGAPHVVRGTKRPRSSSARAATFWSRRMSRVQAEAHKVTSRRLPAGVDIHERKMRRLCDIYKKQPFGKTFIILYPVMDADARHPCYCSS